MWEREFDGSQPEEGCEETKDFIDNRPRIAGKFEGGYLLPEEIPKYCGIIEGVTPGDTRTASALIDSYLGQSFEPMRHTERVKLLRHFRGKLAHHPVITIQEVFVLGNCVFGSIREKLAPHMIAPDPENDGYFTFTGHGGLHAVIYGIHPYLLEITYVSGYDRYPERLKIACGMLACNIRQAMSFNGAKSLSSLDFQVLMTDDSFFTSDIKRLLQEFK